MTVSSNEDLRVEWVVASQDRFAESPRWNQKDDEEKKDDQGDVSSFIRCISDHRSSFHNYNEKIEKTIIGCSVDD